MNKKAVVAMSGGVDSSVAAALLKRSGFDVAGVFIKFWKDGKSAENSCCSVESEKMARLVAKKIGIPFYVINAEKEFKKKVVDYFLSEYKKGNTPNPCVVCNKEIKFGILIEKALKMGADYIATGHYARISSLSLRGRSEATDEAIQSYRLPRRPYRIFDLRAPRNDIYFKLHKGKDKEKDQSYFLWQLRQNQLKHVLFPVGNYTKPEVRELAEKFDLPSAETPESQEVCFVQNSTNEFLKKYLKTKPGKIIELKDVRHPAGRRTSPKAFGQHQGLHFYTIGQRKGLEIPQGPWYVVAKDFKNNNLIVSKDEKDLMQKELIAKNVNWISGKELKLPIKIEVKIRYRSNLADAVLYSKYTLNSAGAKIRVYKIVFDKPQKAVTSGQSVVFYKGKELLGGGVIFYRVKRV
ncbi:MAG: tRNA 2-thiouridine(34) synthase MnmA [Candidatus Staskawiczbacteria bacterium RIFOXYD2_FULL_37_9]|uniref:tRNA-specific 2-thiouridylase MnmA n=1 Tax=Candidatus Staskawiczbacteria bacterium RIFOXYB1_FULL_37_44 TaxID=1802223 RepID=A0A1G2IXT6_9BACT|nr:MAG: tRNA 2-thiouridine(34) synthase MnmA [Candidatus Staskawiczbacteria bacterium RIFOXYB1_FULL_37_44]OGZ83415.1 MAG: tRNA 2-thiouridine(34) synthase MnmA [Candidatus Staskawiczbacteria bacterium RIFOXYC1_FULL_37_52]OGZ88818.1 MAG: tRNA 2-thiouridine(34) synthase MnmA [Candidatus Staskawiczbacteria bacterium RIFOXYD1_FULL_37_110]OGZ94876.1 MAG: tRNA 2-thiouridine(34) synthase MnmA [Candidatus Staskawiczbacteria bacterium RIFOXYD2_FULL_37_9]